MMRYAKIDRDLQARAFKEAEEKLKGFQIQKLLEHKNNQSIWRHGRSPWYRHVYCWDGKTSFHSFGVMEYGANLVVTGDMGEWIWSRETNMLEWARIAWQSTEYFASKLAAHPSDQPTEFFPQACADWFREQYDEAGSNQDRLLHLDNLRSRWTGELSDLHSEYEFHRLLWDSAIDVHEMPCCTRYTYQFHWIQRAVGWLAESLEQSNEHPR